MGGLSTDTPVPVEIKLHKASRFLELTYETGEQYKLSFEFLRVFSPSAEVRGHGVGQETLQIGKRDIDIIGLEPVGTYAIRPVFSDGHDSGLYSWDILRTLCLNHDTLWQGYLDQLAAVDASRDPALCPPLPEKPAPTCGVKS